jgi:hypothetical protein
MRVVNDSSGDYADGPTVKINLTRFSTDSTSDVLFYGYQSLFNGTLRNAYEHYKRKILLNLWQPTEYCAPSQFKEQATSHIPDGNLYNYFDEIYSICPYTIDFQERYTGEQKYKLIWHPFAPPEDYGGPPLDYRKLYDVCYFGGIHGDCHQKMAKVLSEYNYRISYLYNMPYVTDIGLSHHSKLQLAAHSKVTVVYNQCALKPEHIHNISTNSDWHENGAFAGLSLDNPIICQLKCRLFEALYCKNVLLIKRDRWNVVERFLPRDCFIYFLDEDDLKLKIDFVLKNYDHMSKQLDANHKLSVRFSGKATYDFIRDGKSC